MHLGRCGFYLFLFTFLAVGAHAEEHADHPLLSRFPGSIVKDYFHADFGKQDFLTRNSAGKIDTKTKEGSITRIYYGLEKETTSVAIIRNAEESLKKAGFQLQLKLSDAALIPFKKSAENIMVNMSPLIIGVSPEYLYMVRQNATGTQHIAICSSSFSSTNFIIYYLILEENQQVFTPLEVSSNEISTGLKENGKIELYGIYFDTGKFNIKPESKPALEKIVKVLKDNPSLKLRIVGHTDNVGDFANNMLLSEQRAQAVLGALVQTYQIAKERLSAHGVASLAPLSTNSSEFGRAKNRRVELVQQ